MNTSVSAVSSAEGPDLQSQLSKYYLWEEVERGIRIYLAPEAVERIQIEVLRAAAASPGHDLEAGGILLGKTEVIEERSITLIVDFVPVPCSHRHGPTYRLSENDVIDFESALARFTTDARGLSIVGYYRSHNRDDLYLSTDDLNLIDRYFPEPDKVFLLVKTLPSGACTAGFFFWENGRIQSEFTYLEVPLAPVQSLPLAELMRPTALKMDNLPTPRDAHQPQPVSKVSATATLTARQRPVWLSRSFAAMVGFVLITLAMLSYWQSKRLRSEGTSPITTSGSLGLRVQRRAESLALTWDPNSRDIQSAQRATLYIVEGNNQRTIDINAKQLRQGTIAFDPTGDDVGLRLEIVRAGQPIATENVRLLLPANPTALPGRESPTNEKVLRTDSLPQVKSVEISGLNSGKVQSGRQTSHVSSLMAPRRVFVLAPNPSSTAAMSNVQFEQPPSIPLESGVGKLIFTEASIRATVPSPSSTTAKTPEIRQPVQQNELPLTPVMPKTPTKATPTPATARSRYVGPQLIRQVDPSIPLELRSMITPGVEFNVELIVDQHGRVTNAKPLSTNGAQNGLIAAEVLKAARAFLFRPAQEDGVNVDSKVVLTVRFKRSATQ
jgi:proteasome lid subunit RPN8/RPN11